MLDTDSFSFIIFKRLYHTSFKLNIANPPILRSPWTRWEAHSVPRPSAAFYSPIHAKRRIFSFLANALGVSAPLMTEVPPPEKAESKQGKYVTAIMQQQWEIFGIWIIWNFSPKKCLYLQPPFLPGKGGGAVYM